MVKRERNSSSQRRVVSLDEFRTHYETQVRPSEQEKFLEQSRASGQLDEAGIAYASGELAKKKEEAARHGGDEAKVYLNEAATDWAIAGDRDRAKKLLDEAANQYLEKNDFDGAILVYFEKGYFDDAEKVAELAEAHYKGKSEPMVRHYYHRKLIYKQQAAHMKEAGSNRGEGKESNLVSKIAAGILAIGGLGVALSFFSHDLTGAAIGISGVNNNFIGAVCFVIGLVGLWMISKK